MDLYLVLSSGMFIVVHRLHILQLSKCKAEVESGRIRVLCSNLRTSHGRKL